MIDETIFNVLAGNGWITVIDCAKLDTALCNSQQRVGFLHLIQRCFTGAGLIANRAYVQWLMKRSIQVERMASDGSVLGEDVMSYFDSLKHYELSKSHGHATALLKFYQNLKHFASLETLTIAANADIHDIELVHAVIQCQKLKEIDLRAMPTLMPSTVPRIIQHCNALTALKLTNCTIVVDKIPARADGISYPLTELYLPGCDTLSDASLINIVSVCPKLQRIDIDGCKELTDAPIDCMDATCSDLVFLSVKDCMRLRVYRLKQLVTARGTKTGADGTTDNVLLIKGRDGQTVNRLKD